MSPRLWLTWWIVSAARGTPPWPSRMGAASGSASLSRLALSDLEQVVEFPDTLRPVQIDDDGTTMSAMGRPALRVRVETENPTLYLISCRFKSKLLTSPDGRFQPEDEDERARYAVYALSRRAAEAATVRAYATELLAATGRNAPSSWPGISTTNQRPTTGSDATRCGGLAALPSMSSAAPHRRRPMPSPPVPSHGSQSGEPMSSNST